MPATPLWRAKRICSSLYLSVLQGNQVHSHWIGCPPDSRCLPSTERWGSNPLVPIWQVPKWLCSKLVVRGRSCVVVRGRSFVVVRGRVWWFVVVRGHVWSCLFVRGRSCVVVRGCSWSCVIVRGRVLSCVVIRGRAWWFVVGRAWWFVVGRSCSCVFVRGRVVVRTRCAMLGCDARC